MEKIVTNVPIKYTEIDDKLVKDGKMALMITESYGMILDEIRYNPTIINMVLQNASDDAIFNSIAKLVHPILLDRYKNFRRRVAVVWIPVGTLFRIERCADDGEFIVTVQNDTWNMA